MYSWHTDMRVTMTVLGTVAVLLVLPYVLITHPFTVFWLVFFEGYGLLIFMQARRINTWGELWRVLNAKPLPRAKTRRKKRR